MGRVVLIWYRERNIPSRGCKDDEVIFRFSAISLASDHVRFSKAHKKTWLNKKMVTQDWPQKVFIYFFYFKNILPSFCGTHPYQLHNFDFRD